MWTARTSFYLELWRRRQGCAPGLPVWLDGYRFPKYFVKKTRSVVLIRLAYQEIMDALFPKSLGLKFTIVITTHLCHSRLKWLLVSFEGLSQCPHSYLLGFGLCCCSICPQNGGPCFCYRRSSCHTPCSCSCCCHWIYWKDRLMSSWLLRTFLLRQ